MAETIKTLNDLDIDIRTTFQVSYEDAEKSEANWFPQLSFTETTNKTSITQEWIHDHAQLQEQFVDQPPTYHGLTGEKAEIALKYYGDALKIRALDISEDNTGLVIRRAGDIGKRAALFPRDLAVVALEGGDTDPDYVIYDGQQFFSNTHTKPNGGNIDNLMAGVFNTTNYQAGRTQMRRFVSDLGGDDVYGIQPTHVIVSPENEVAMLELLRNTTVEASGAAINNVLSGSATGIIENRLTDTNDWYLGTTEFNGLMPFIEVRHSEFGNFVLYSETSNGDPAFRDHWERRWWGRMAMTVFFTRPETMIKFVN